MHTCVPQYVYGGQRSTHRNQFSPSTVCSADWSQTGRLVYISTFTVGPPHWLSFSYEIRFCYVAVDGQELLSLQCGDHRFMSPPPSSKCSFCLRSQKGQISSDLCIRVNNQISYSLCLCAILKKAWDDIPRLLPTLKLACSKKLTTWEGQKNWPSNYCLESDQNKKKIKLEWNVAELPPS